MSAAPKVYGWCPGALRPMMSGDGLVVRIRAPLGRLTQDQAHGVADLSRRFGNGLLDVSARANLQMRGVREDAHSDLISRLRDLGLVDDDTAAEARRNVMLAPFWSVGDDTHSIARDLSAALTAATDLALPGKFGFAVDCGPRPVLQDIAADIRIEQGANGLILRADGSVTGLPVTRQNATAEALALARWFLESGGAPGGRGRMKAHIARGVPLPGNHNSPASFSACHVHPGAVAAGFLVALEFGQITADALGQLASLAAIRLTPWRMLLLEGLATCASFEGVIINPDDPRLRVVACTGASGCPQALGPTRELAFALAHHVPAGQKLHVSGCAKGCAHPGPAQMTLTATGPDRYDLIRNGSAADEPTESNLRATALTDAPDLLIKGT